MERIDKITILDFGSQYTQLIARRIREMGVFSEILPSESLAEKVSSKGIILSGGPNSVYDKEAPKCDKKIFELGIPILGICYGMQLMASMLGGKVVKGYVKEYGKTNIKIKRNDGIFSGLKNREMVWMSHTDIVIDIPNGFEITGMTENDLIASMVNESKRLYAIQFHPEVTHTQNGIKILQNFVFNICKCSPKWTAKNIIECIKMDIIKTVGCKNVIVFVSGGVDSSVTAALLSQSLDKKQIYAMYIDTGFMRKGEAQYVKALFNSLGLKNYVIKNCSNEFIALLKGVCNPEEKRRLIGNKFIDIQKSELERLSMKDAFLAQGTLYTDMIESGKGVGKKADKIKTHHNVASDVIDSLRKRGKVIEPLSKLFKDEVRKLGNALGLSDNIIQRHPFPGPGFAIRIICGSVDIDENFHNIAMNVKSISEKYGFNGFLSPIKTVGVQGDARTYKNLAIIEGDIKWERVRNVCEDIVRNVDMVNRVVLIIRSKVTIRQDLIENPKLLRINKSTINLLRDVDFIANETIREFGLERKISQMPVIMFPGQNNPWIALRPIKTEDFMTAKPMEIGNDIPILCVERMAERIMRLNIDGVVYDVTDKPPATIEWE